MEPENNFWWRLTHLDPAVYRGLVMAIVLLLASFGVVVSDDIPVAVVGFVAALLAIVQALWTKNAVTPNAKVVAYLPDPAQPRIVAAGEAVTTASDATIVAVARETVRLK